MDNSSKRSSFLKRWGSLAAWLAFIWFFGMYLGPFITDHVPTYQKIVQTIEERDIDSGAYFYTEIKASYEGERYLRQTLQIADPDEYGFTLSFISGIVLCILILALGYKFMPSKEEPFNHR